MPADPLEEIDERLTRAEMLVAAELRKAEETEERALGAAGEQRRRLTGAARMHRRAAEVHARAADLHRLHREHESTRLGKAAGQA